MFKGYQTLIVPKASSGAGPALHCRCRCRCRYLALDAVIVDVPEEDEPDVVVGLVPLLHLVHQPPVVVRVDDGAVHNVLGRLQGRYAWGGVVLVFEVVEVVVLVVELVVVVVIVEVAGIGGTHRE